MVTVAKLASTELGGFSLEKVMEQLRIAFQKKSISDSEPWSSSTESEKTKAGSEKPRKKRRVTRTRNAKKRKTIVEKEAIVDPDPNTEIEEHDDEETQE